MAGSAIIGGVLLSMIEGIGILFTRISADQFRNPVPPNISEAAPGFGDFNSSSGYGFQGDDKVNVTS